MNELAKIDPKEYGLEEKQVVTIEQAFAPKIAERDGFAKVYENLITKEITKETCTEARELRLKLVKVRTGIAEIHKTQKAYFLAAGKFVDAWKNKETEPVEQMEESLTDIEKYYDRLESEKIAKLEAERKAELTVYSEVVPAGLGTMDENVYRNYLTGLKVAYEARIKAEQEAEAERLRLIEIEKENARLKAIEDEKIRKENERLKKEAEAKEKALAAERAKVEAERKAEAERQAAILAKERAEQIRLLQIERDRQAKLEAELKSKKDAEIAAQKAKEKAERERMEAEKKAAKAPRKEKLTKWVDSFQLPAFENDLLATEIIEKFNAYKNWAKSIIEKI
jgi:uncharacterized membrane protein YqiK